MAKTITDIRDILPDPDYVRIFDTTLRDGEQSPGCTMNVEEKVAIARQLERLNVDIIEAGFAASSPGDFESVHRVAEAVTQPIVLSLSRTREEDVDAALRAVDKAAQSRHPHLHRDLRHPSEVQAQHDSRGRARAPRPGRSTRAKKHLDYIEFSCEDASRSRLGLHGQDLRRGHPRRRPHHQSARHHRPRDSRGVRRDVRLHARAKSRAPTASSGARTATTTSAWRSPTRWPRSETARARSNARSTVSASAPATPRWKRS